MTKLSVVIVNYNVKLYLERCLSTMQTALGTLPAEVLVIDNASTDGSEAYLRERFPHIIYIYNKVNAGFAAACNQGIRRAGGEYVLLLNPDTEFVEAASLEKAVAFMDAHQQAGAAGVRMFTPSGEYLRESARSYPTLAATFGKLTGLGRLFPTLSTYYTRVEEGTPCEVEVLAGAFMLLRRQAIDKCGLLDEDFFMYGEDIDLSCRIRKAGYQNWSLPIRLVHHKGASTNRHSAAHLHCFYGSMEIFYRKHGRGRLRRGAIVAAIRLLWGFKLLQLVFWRLFHSSLQPTQSKL